MRAFFCLGGCIFALAIAGCEKPPEPRKELEFNAIELKAKKMIESVGGEIGERDAEGRITMVILEGEKVIDATLKPLENLKNLEILELRNTKVTAKGIVSIRKALPKCHITAGPTDTPEKKK